MYSYSDVITLNMLFRKFLWLCHRLRILFFFFFKIFFVFKCSSIYYDYSLGLYPKIFNDQGFFMRLDEFLSYLNMLFLFYFFEFLFIFSLVILCWFIYKPHAIHFQLYFDHHEDNMWEIDENSKNIIDNKLDIHLGNLKSKDSFFCLKSKKELINEKKFHYKSMFNSKLKN